MRDFVRVYDMEKVTHILLNVNQITWIDLNANKIQLSSGTEMCLDAESSEKIVKVIEGRYR